MDTPEGIEVTGPIHDRFEEILSPRALDLIGLLHRELGQQRERLLASRGDRFQKLAEAYERMP